ncbi:hypothetical protein RFI_14068 [Reticulomyxa filosa]|uniref:Uncharacterized protein n=1 Tax=Reticulomyxa filosa TaxID=46433 RepID=X6N9Z2_RETFI|nr:hypothetical protein RFI_14068 [Reticulomyxa filosa]|eukprot:ETO23115.1 hypothetical protein RFI_14068 [Reticulomyxa filosa]
MEANGRRGKQSKYELNPLTYYENDLHKQGMKRSDRNKKSATEKSSESEMLLTHFHDFETDERNKESTDHLFDPTNTTMRSTQSIDTNHHCLTANMSLCDYLDISTSSEYIAYANKKRERNML